MNQQVDEYLDAYTSYFEQPLPRCIALQNYLQPIEGLAILMADLPDRGSSLIENYASLYRQCNPNLSIAKSKLLAEVAQNICTSLFFRAIQSDESHRQELYAEIKDVLYGYLNPHIGDHLLVLHNHNLLPSWAQVANLAGLYRLKSNN